MGQHQRFLARARNHHALHAFARQVRDVSVKPKLRVGIHRNAPFREPGLVFIGPPHIGTFRHIALGAHAPPANHQFHQRRALRIQNAQQGGSGARAHWVFQPEPIKHFRIARARFHQAEFREPRQQFAKLLLPDRIITLSRQHPDITATDDFKRAIMPAHLNPRSIGQPLRETRKGKAARARWWGWRLWWLDQQSASHRNDRSAAKQNQGTSLHIASPL